MSEINLSNEFKRGISEFSEDVRECINNIETVCKEFEKKFGMYPIVKFETTTLDLKLVGKRDNRIRGPTIISMGQFEETTGK